LPRDVDNDPTAAQELADLGFLTVPVVVLPGKPALPGFNVKELGAAIGVADRSLRPSLGLVLENFDLVLGAVLATTAQLRDADLKLKMPNRDRDLGGLIHDVFYKTVTWAPEIGRPSPRHAPSQKEEAARYPDVPSLLRYGEATRAALRERFSPDRDYSSIVETADGPMPLADVVTWLADHSAHHLRQMYWLMENTLGISPEDPLDLTALPGITLQATMW
jgi:hypothetical protein